mmetsp:Transcript_100261/g.156646  ORF Transcript_100261/g.156646 Transcript_100261/m.156646 type:complete len:171 (-) Transcript_100261:798-1310(-)
MHIKELGDEDHHVRLRTCEAASACSSGLALPRPTYSGNTPSNKPFHPRCESYAFDSFDDIRRLSRLATTASSEPIILVPHARLILPASAAFKADTGTDGSTVGTNPSERIKDFALMLKHSPVLSNSIARTPFLDVADTTNPSPIPYQGAKVPPSLTSTRSPKEKPQSGSS